MTRRTARPSRATPHRPRPRPSAAGAGVVDDRVVDATVAQLRAIERQGGDGTLSLPDGVALPVTSLDRVYFPATGATKRDVTKGDVMRFYARLSPALLPAIADRPLVLRRYPAGIDGPSFHQHDPGPHTPPGVRTELVVAASAPAPERRLVGAGAAEPGPAIATLLYPVQLGAIPINAWHSRVGAIDSPDYAVLDLDPHPKAGFARVVEVARLVRDALRRRALDALVKTSGSRGLHLLVPLGPDASYDASAALAAEVAAEVAASHPALATVERSLDERRPGTVYVDHLQNAAGKTLAAVFAVRARPGATVSTPLGWSQVTRTLDPNRYTIASVARQRTRHMARWAAAWPEGNPGGRRPR